MRKKSVILSLILSLLLFLAGAAALGWVSTERKKEEQFLQERQERFNAGLDELDRLVTGEIDVHSFAYLVPRENRQQELDKYKARVETRELIFVVSIMCMLIGVAIFSWWLLLWTARPLIRGLLCLGKFFADVFSRRRKIIDKQLVKALEQEREGRDRLGQLKKRSRILANSGWHGFDASFANQYEPGPSEKVSSMRSEAHFGNPAKDADNVAVPLAKEKSAEPDRLWKAANRDFNVRTAQFGPPFRKDQKAALLDSGDNYPELEGLLKTQTENLEKQMAEFKQMAQSVQQTALEHSEPLKNNLEELIQQVSAIREYALQQQGRMEKLQDGYDWNIIRTFCLRIIRCIDNLENRIAGLARENVETTNLKEVRDELIFALESSGVERFEPKISSDYRGQEKRAEAVRDKQGCNDPELKGKVAKVIRPGYQYVIDEDNVKVVRTAQVKLFG